MTHKLLIQLFRTSASLMIWLIKYDNPGAGVRPFMVSGMEGLKKLLGLPKASRGYAGTFVEDESSLSSMSKILLEELTQSAKRDGAPKKTATSASRRCPARARYYSRRNTKKIVILSGTCSTHGSPKDWIGPIGDRILKSLG